MKIASLLFIVLITWIQLIGRVVNKRDLFLKTIQEEIEYLNATCPETNNCREDKSDDDLNSYTCNCEEFCTQFDTCCLDSKYRGKKPANTRPYKCVTVYGTKGSVYMVDTCHPSWNDDESVDEMCRATAEERDYLFLAVPVTNRVSGVTYRNYYCALCNMEGDRNQLTFWDLSLRSRTEDIMDYPLPGLHYNSTAEAWIVGKEIYDLADDQVFPSVVAPDAVRDMVHDCVAGVISDCADNWTGASVEDKCHSYFYLSRVRDKKTYVQKVYRNPHCALCNYESFERKVCRIIPIYKRQSAARIRPFVWLFSRNEKETSCGRGRVYDPIAKKCRRVYKIKI